MTILDIVLVVVWAGITLGGFFKGAIRIIFGLGGVALGIWLSVVVAPDLALSLTGLVNSEWLTLILAYLVPLVVVMSGTTDRGTTKPIRDRAVSESAIVEIHS